MSSADLNCDTPLAPHVRNASHSAFPRSGIERPDPAAKQEQPARQHRGRHKHQGEGGAPVEMREKRAGDDRPGCPAQR